MTDSAVRTHDVVVLGTGSAGLTAALAANDAGADVGVYEKAEKVGGTTAWSGGMVWIPGNHHMAEVGLSDSREDVLTYLGTLTHGMVPSPLLESFVDNGPMAIRWLEENTPTVFQIIEGFPDYHPEHQGGRVDGGRSLECPLYPYAELGDWADRVTRGYQLTGAICMGETTLGRGAPEGVPAEEMARRAVRDERGAGQGLVGPLLKGLLDRGIEPYTGARGVELLVEDGRVTGVTVETSEGRQLVRARKGVILATGGFEHDRQLVDAFLRGPMERPVSVPTNTGDGLKMAMRIGASLGNMREAWWIATMDVDQPGWGQVPWMVNGERSRPHSIMVNSRGKRFTNEAANYNALGAAFHVIDVVSYEYANHPAWMVFDDYFWKTYGLAGHTSDGDLPGGVVSADSVGELAERIGVPSAALEETVREWNSTAVEGIDPHFHRGEGASDRWWGDPDKPGSSAANIGPLDTAPFHAVQIRSGALGTKGGPQTDEYARVLDVDSEPIDGLYAVGNVMASAMGMTYGGAGGTLGPGVVFGWVAGRHAAGVQAGVTA